MCSLAGGADQIFAHALLAAGGHLHGIVPSANSDESFACDDDRTAFTRLLDQAAERTDLPFSMPTEEAYMEAAR